MEDDVGIAIMKQWKNVENVAEKYTAVIQAGGKGTRLKALTHDKIPKPLLEMGGKPMIEWQLEKLICYGVKKIVIIIGYLGEKIEKYFEDGSKWNVEISYIKEREVLGSGGALYFLKEKCETDFLFIFGDVMFDIDWNRFIEFHERKGGYVSLLIHPNSHPYDSDLVVMDEKAKVISFDYKGEKRTYLYDNCVNAGLYICKVEMLNLLKEGYSDLERDILSELVSKGLVYGYKTTEYVRDAGTVERFQAVADECDKGRWSSRNLQNLQKCIFLDRDGTINKYKGLICSIDELELESNAAEAICRMNHSDYLVIVITNQSVIARGLCDIATVKNIHRKMSVLLGEKGAYVDDIVFCPHHPDKGYPEENIAYKIQCNCRKPATGMIDKMIKKYHINKMESYVIGDTTTDIQLGKNAGIKSILVHTGQAGMDGKYDLSADMEAEDLLDAFIKIQTRDENNNYEGLH